MIRVGIIGYGKIAGDQHVPAMAGNDAFRFTAAASRTPMTLEVPTYTDYHEMLAEAEIDAVSICTPPSVRYAIARDCLEAGRHVMLEKPPGVTLGEVEALEALAKARGVTLMTTWHTQANPAVVATAALLKGQDIRSMRIDWREDVRKWHPGQQWIWEAGGFGVFDPGINALSIATRIVPAALIVKAAKLSVPANRAMPIAAELVLASAAADGDIPVSFDFRQVNGEVWTITLSTDAHAEIVLSEGGSKLTIDGVMQAVKGEGEYPALYTQFARLVADGRSHVDLEPLRIVADAFMMATRETVDAFED